MDTSLAIEDSKALLALCPAGKLYGIERWISAGRSIVTDPSLRKTALITAVETGFHSLVELLAQHEPRQEQKDRALAGAVERRRLDLVEALVEHGARIESVPFDDVLLTWERPIMRFFLDHGADAVTGKPFAMAFQAKVQNALRIFVDYREAHPELANALQSQVDRALRHFAAKGDLKWVSLMMWAGADPRSVGPDLDDRYAEDPECHTTAFREACSGGKLDVLKRLKPDSARDNISELLNWAAIADSKDVIDYLVHLGAHPNDKSGGGSPALDRCLWDLPWGDRGAFLSKALASKWALRDRLDRIERLLKAGALWRPDTYGVNSVRQMLLKCEPDVTVALMKLFAKYKTAPAETVEKLLDTPRMRGHLSRAGMRL